MKEKILLIIPAYNESKSIMNTIEKVNNYNAHTKQVVDYIVINDGSTDETAQLLDKNSICHIDSIMNLGIGGAVQTGYKYAYYNDYDIAIQFDGDGQHDINYIQDIVEPILNRKSNMVIGSRFIDKDSSKFKSSGLRRLGIKLISFCIKIKTGKKIYDTTSGFRAVDKSLIKFFADSYPVEYPEPISTVEILKHNFRVAEVPVSMNERTYGKSSIKSLKSIYYMFNVVFSILCLGRRK